MSDHDRWEPQPGAGGVPSSPARPSGDPDGAAPPAPGAGAVPTPNEYVTTPLPPREPGQGPSNGTRAGAPSWASPSDADQDWGPQTSEVRPSWATSPSWGPDSSGSAWGTNATSPLGSAAEGSAWDVPGSPPQPGTAGAGPNWPPPGDQPGQRRPGRFSLGRTVAAAVVAAVLLATGYGLRALSDRGSSTSAGVPTASGAPVAVSAPVQSGTEPVAAVAKALLPTVVQLQTDNGLGSGVIYDRNGYILTAAHVVGGADHVTVRLSDGTQTDGRVVGTDQGNDVAVVKVDRTGLRAAPLALGVPIQVGQTAVAIGSPFGLDQTVTAGVVSASHRALPISQQAAVDAIQTDAPINPGNSGGALADRQGRVIGINDAIRSESGGNVGIGFAIPIDTAAASATRIVKGLPPLAGFLGVSSHTQTQGHAGALIDEVVGGSPAAKAGMKVGDLITAVNGRTVEGSDDLSAIVRSLEPGRQATVKVLRGGQEVTLNVTLGSRPDAGNG
jgi:putative serine protease PepD